MRLFILVRNLFFLCLFLLGSQLFAKEALKPIIFPEDHGQHVSATVEGWMFSGEITTEEGETYAYMYQLKQKNKKISIFANVVDLSIKKTEKSEAPPTVFEYKYTEQLDDEGFRKMVNRKQEQEQIKSMEWKVGKAFIKYNVIGDSWFFGVEDDKNGFNFRVKGVRNYVLNGENGYLSHKNDNYEASYSAQSMSINGHLTLGGKSRFVTGKNSWFEHVWSRTFSGQQVAKYVLITCRFNDNTGLMLYENLGDIKPVKLKTGTYQNALDEKKLLSNFSLVKSIKTQQWRISIPALKIDIKALGDTISEYDIIHLKDDNKDNKEGFCFVNQKGF